MPAVPRSRSALPILALIALVALFFFKLVFTNLILARGDTLLYIYPNWAAAAQALRAGRLPLWNPNIFMGAPLLANSQVGFLYPFNWPLWLVFDVPTAASLSIALHVVLAAVLCYGFCRSGLGMRKAAAWIAATLFALGGYLTAQVEHINQLQGLAWMPAVFWLLSGAQKGRSLFRRTLLLAIVFALQFLAGHTQAVFITVIGAAIYSCWIILHIFISSRPSISINLLPLALMAGAGIGALVLASAQILPTIELTRQSMRSGGLPFNEAISFSLHPLLFGKALLPNYGGSLFSEYIAALPVSALLLALTGLYCRRRDRRIAGIALVGAAGLFFALGAANPVYRLLVSHVPGFDLFRAPARWLALYALCAAVLAGAGLDTLLAGKPVPRRLLLIVWLGISGVLIGWSFLAPRLTAFIPEPPESPVAAPLAFMLGAWIIELILTGILFIDWKSKLARYSPMMIAAIVTIVLYFSSRALPYNHPTTPDAYRALRPASAFLKAASKNSLVPGRFLSMSNIFFDPGDNDELESIYGDQLDPDAFYDLIIATKNKEISSPNLPMALGYPSVDGYDGGVLPLASYAALEQLLLPAESITSDGRLRENLKTIPEGRWLNLFNTRYLITDKVGDAWVDGVFYDLQHSADLDANHPSVRVAYLPDYEATGLGVITGSKPGQPAGTVLGSVQVEFKDRSSETLELTSQDNTATFRIKDDGTTLQAARLQFSRPGAPSRIEIILQPGVDSFIVNGMSLLDSRDDTFQSLVVSGNGRYRLVHSGDVKIYENLDVLPRAFLAGQAIWASDDEDALNKLLAADLDPSKQVVLSGSDRLENWGSGSITGKAIITCYQPERVEIEVQANEKGWLVLADAFYPGWEAFVDDVATPIYRADLLFRAVPIDSGSRKVVFTFQPSSVRIGVALSGAACLLCLILLVISLFLGKSNGNPHRKTEQDRCP